MTCEKGSIRVHTNEIQTGGNNNNNNHNIMDVYLRKHRLDLKLIPNKNLVKLTDGLIVNANDSPVHFSLTTGQIESMLQNANPDSSSLHNLSDAVYSSSSSSLSTSSSRSVSSDEDDDDQDEEEEDEDEEEKTEAESESNKPKKKRKKREPSLKLQQKLNNADLELIVSCVKSKKANVYIADVKKDNYIDKILRVKLVADEQNVQLSNGYREALLKKSMFPKELNALFDTFVSSLCGQESVVDEKGLVKPALKCLVIDCDFKSFSEAEINRHIKRHLAQDGFTCSTCAHQFASMTNLQRHLRIHNGNVGKEIKCPNCDYMASTITHVKRHMAHKHLERSLPCPHCSFMGATNAELKIHIARKHLELTGKNPLFLPKYLRKDYHCGTCKIQFTDFKEYQTHMYEHTSSSNRFRCSECPYNCKNYSKLKRHMLYHAGARNFECKVCGNKFFQMEHLKRHMQSIHNSCAAELNTLTAKPSESKPDSNLSNKKINKIIELKQKSIDEPPNDETNLPLIDNVDDDKPTMADDTVLSTNLTYPNDDEQTGAKINNNCVNQIDQSQTYHKVISKCLYKCQKCDYSSTKLFNLNQHVINKHSKELVNFMALDCDKRLTKSLPDNRDLNSVKSSLLRNESHQDDDEDDEEDDDDDEEDDDDSDEDENDSDEENFSEEQCDNKLVSKENFSQSRQRESNNNFYLCSFCCFTTNKKSILNAHLKINHSNQLILPIILPNDPAVLDSNTKFECGNCLNSCFNNLSQFAKHMDDNHKVQVFLTDANNQLILIQYYKPSMIPDISKDQPAKMDDELMVDVKNTNTMVNSNINNNNNNNSNCINPTNNGKYQKKAPRLKSFYRHRNTTISASRQFKNTPNTSPTTVRINPYILKTLNKC